MSNDGTWLRHTSLILKDMFARLFEPKVVLVSAALEY